MFSGIVESTGVLKELNEKNGCIDFKIEPKIIFNDLNIGDSVAVNGVCLTVTSIQNNLFSFTAVPETLRATNLDCLTQGSLVNLERSMKMNARIGGHYVQGHVDSIGKITDIKNDNSHALLARISVSKSLIKYIVPKGYITIDGMSITVINVGNDWFTVTFIPHTQDVTITNQYKLNSLLNIEVDIMGKYIEKSLGAYVNAN